MTSCGDTELNNGGSNLITAVSALASEVVIQNAAGVQLCHPCLVVRSAPQRSPWTATDKFTNKADVLQTK